MDKNTTYQVLRDEMVFLMQRYDNYHIAAYTVCVALWSLAITEKSAWLTLIPLIIMLPISLRMCECRYVIEKLGTYLSVCVEDKRVYSWEYMKNKLETAKKKNNSRFRSKHSFIYNISKFSLVFLCIISSGLFWCIEGAPLSEEQYCLRVHIIVFQSVTTLVQLIVWLKNMDTSRYRYDLCADWRVIKHNVTKIKNRRGSDEYGYTHW